MNDKNNIPKTSFQTDMLPRQNIGSSLSESLIISLKWLFLSIILFFIWAFLFVSLNSVNEGAGGAFLGVSIIAVIAISGWAIYRHAKKQEALFNAFLSANGFIRSFPEGIDATNQPFIYGTGHSQRIQKNFKGEVNGLTFWTYKYTYTRGHGKRRRDYTYTVLYFQLDKFLPHLILDSKVNDSGFFSNIPQYIDDSQRIELEGHFNKKFDFFAPKGYSADALDILSPEFMTQLLDFHTSFDVEIDGHNVYVITSGDAFTELKMAEMLRTAEILTADLKFKMKSWSMQVKPENMPDLEMHAGESVLRIGNLRLRSGYLLVLVVLYYFFNLFGSQANRSTLPLMIPIAVVLVVLTIWYVHNKSGKKH